MSRLICYELISLLAICVCVYEAGTSLMYKSRRINFVGLNVKKWDVKDKILHITYGMTNFAMIFRALIA